MSCFAIEKQPVLMSDFFTPKSRTLSRTSFSHATPLSSRTLY